MPPRKTEQPPRTGAARAAGAGAAAGAVTGVAGAPALAAPSVAGLAAIGAAGVISAAGIAAISKGLVDALDSDASFGDADIFLFTTLREQYPSRPSGELRRIVDREQEFEVEFRRKMRDRLLRDLPQALVIADPAARQEAVLKLLARERRYTLMREEAMLERALARVEFNLLREQSPRGAFWKLSPHVREHTLDCIAMGEKFWPWAVLDRIHPPLHVGCPCSLWGLDEAIAAGLMTADQVPDEEDAIRRADDLVRRVKELQDALGIEEVALVVEELLREGSTLEEARSTDNTGAMVALYPTPRTARALALDGGERADDLHVTLAFLGDAKDLGDTDKLKAIVELIAATAPLLEGEVSGVGLFTKGPKPVTYASIDVPGLERVRERLAAALRGGGFPPNTEHGFTPHMTVAYEDRRDEVKIPQGKLRFSHLTVAIGGRYTSYPFEGEPLQEARHKLRWPKGFTKGGRFRPARGGFGERVARKLMRGGPPVSPARARTRGDARRTWVGGVYTRIPEHEEWRRGRYYSPPGSTNVYRDGTLVSEPGKPSLPEERRRPPAPPGSATPELATRIEALQDERRGDALQKAKAALATRRGSKPPISEGDGPEALLALVDAGFELRSTNTTLRGDALKFGGGGAELYVEFDGEVVRRVEWEPHPAPKMVRKRSDGPPDSYREFAADALAWADELGARFGAKVVVPEIRVDEGRVDHSGSHEWTGEVDVGRDVPVDIDRAARARRRGYALTEDERRGVYSSYWVTAHEVSHGVNPIDSHLFSGANANLEEALAEEAAHLLAAERLFEQGQADVVEWRLANPDAVSNYPLLRHTLSGLFDEMGLEDQAERREFLLELKFSTDPAERFDRIAERLQAQRGGDHDELFEHAVAALASPEYDGGELRQVAQPAPPQSPGDWIGKLSHLFDEPKGKKPKKPKKPPKPQFIGGTPSTKPSQGPIPSYEAVRLRLDKGAGGSNGARWAFDSKGRRWIVKDYRGNQDRVATELLANAIYRELGAKVAEAGEIEVKGKPAITYPTLEAKERPYVFFDYGPNAEVGKHFMTDALLANWDFVGMTDDNILWAERAEEVAKPIVPAPAPPEEPIRIDQGGTFEFRAMGQPKPYGPIPTEVWTMRTKGQAARAAKVTEPQMRQQARKIVKALKPERVDELFDAAPFKDEDMRARVRENLKARIGWMDEFAKGKIELPKPLESDKAAASLMEKEREFALYPEQEDALFAYVEGMDEEIDGHLRSGKFAHEGSKPVRRAITQLDSMFRGLDTTEEDVIAYVGLDLGEKPEEFADKLVGHSFEERGYFKASLDPAEARKYDSMIRVLIPEGSHALFTPGLGYEDMPDEPQLILARDARVRVGGKRKQKGKLVFDATVSTRKPFKPFKPLPPKGGKDKPWKLDKPLSGQDAVDFLNQLDTEPESSVWDDIGEPEPPQAPGTRDPLGRYVKEYEPGGMFAFSPFDQQGILGMRQALGALGHSRQAVASTERLMDRWNHADDEAKLDITRHLIKDTPTGRALRERIRLETRAAEKLVKEHPRTRLYRQGSISEPLMSTTTDPSGAHSIEITGKSPHFVPDHNALLKKLLERYAVLGGFHYQPGYAGEEEVALIDRRIVDGKATIRKRPKQNWGRFGMKAKPSEAEGRKVLDLGERLGENYQTFTEMRDVMNKITYRGLGDNAPAVTPGMSYYHTDGTEYSSEDVMDLMQVFKPGLDREATRTELRHLGYNADRDEDGAEPLNDGLVRLLGYDAVTYAHGGEQVFEIFGVPRDPNAGKAEIVFDQPKPPQSPGTLAPPKPPKAKPKPPPKVKPPANLPEVPHFYTPNQAAKKENIAAATHMRGLAQQGNLDALKAFEVNPKAQKVQAYKQQLIDALTKPPKAQPKTALPEPSAAQPTPGIADAEAALGEFGIEIGGAQSLNPFSILSGESVKPGVHGDKGWLKILSDVRDEAEQLNERYPGITEGVKLSRQRPANPGALGSYDLHTKTLVLRIPGAEDPYKNKYGQPWSVFSDMRGVFRHELGHARDYASEVINRDALKQTDFRDDDGNPLNTARWAKRNVSEYAGTMTSEAVGELFALYTSPGYKKGRLPKRVEQIMEALATGGTPPPPEKEIPLSKLGDPQAGIMPKGLLAAPPQGFSVLEVEGDPGGLLTPEMLRFEAPDGTILTYEEMVEAGHYPRSGDRLIDP